jgi:hypothetical protein
MNARRVYAYEDTTADLGTYEFPRYEQEDAIRQARELELVATPALDGTISLMGDGPSQGPQVITKRWTWLETSRTALQTEIDTMLAVMAGGAGRLWRYSAYAEQTMQYQWTPVLVDEIPAPTIRPENKLMLPCVARFVSPVGVWLFEATKPHVYGETGLVYGTVGAGGSGAIYGTSAMVYDVADAGSPYSVSIELTNRGNSYVRAMVITVTAETGGLNGLTVTNSTTGHTFTQSGALADTQVWEWDTYRPRVRKNTGSWALDWGNFTVGSSQRGIFALAPGANTITFSSSNAMDGNCSFAFYEASV